MSYSAKQARRCYYKNLRRLRDCGLICDTGRHPDLNHRGFHKFEVSLLAWEKTKTSAMIEAFLRSQSAYLLWEARKGRWFPTWTFNRARNIGKWIDARKITGFHKRWPCLGANAWKSVDASAWRALQRAAL